MAIVGAMLMTASCTALRPNVSGNFAASAVLAQPPQPWEQGARLRVVTWNIHDMIVLTKQRSARMDRIGAMLAELQPDVVCLQEGFVRGDVGRIADVLAEIGLTEVRDYPSMAVGSGLWILSRFPIDEAYFHAYSRNGAWHKFSQGDWWAGKGVALARLTLPDGRLLDVYNTHLIASYGIGDGSNHEDRAVQAEELVHFVLGATPPSIPALLLGDLNSGPGGASYDAIANGLDAAALMNSGRWLDHILGVREGAPYTMTVTELVPLSGWIEHADGREPLSDHTGYLIEVEITPRPLS